MESSKSNIKIKLLCNWTNNLHNDWRRMSKDNDLKWNNIEIVTDNPDYYIIINATNESHTPKKTIIFHMEPNVERNINLWGSWSKPDRNKYLNIMDHHSHYNILEWHLSKTYRQLSDENIIKTKILSTVVSSKYNDIGHKKRIDFLMFLQKQEENFIDVYGYCGNLSFKNYKGPLPIMEKDDGLFPYKYTFAAENNRIYNYITEKLTDSILSECLCFYFGSPNVSDYIDHRAYVVLNLDDFQHDYELVKKAICENWWEKKISIIRKEKQKILNELQFFPMVDKIINNIED